MLAGGTQMLAVYGLARRLEENLDRVVVGTTRWVMDDPTGNTLELAKRLGNVPLVATQMNFSQSRHAQLQRYEQGFVKEGVGAGGMAIAAHLLAHWEDRDYLAAIEGLMG
jgi:NaMN:DMB phosphoribosyltransferase